MNLLLDQFADLVCCDRFAHLAVPCLAAVRPFTIAMILSVDELEGGEQVGLRPGVGGPVTEEGSCHNGAGLRRWIVGVVGVNADAQDGEKYCIRLVELFLQCS